MQGNAGFRAATVASYQALGAGVAFPYNAIKLVSPTGSALHGQAQSQSRAALKRSTSTRAASLTLVSALNLYTDGGVFSGNTAKISYFTDSAGTQPAGSVTLTLPSGVSADSSDPTSYASYPVVIPIVVKLTGGNIPCQGNFTLTLTGATGANSLVGSMTLTKDNVNVNLNLGLDNDLNVSGTITVKENGATIQATGVTGPLTGTLTCNATVLPYKWTGTGTLSLLEGTMSLSLNTGSGTSSATADSAGNVSIVDADGTKDTIHDTFLAGLVSGSNDTITKPGSGTGTNPTASYSIADLNAYDVPLALNNNGQLITGPNNLTFGVFTTAYRSSPTAAPQILPGLNGYTQIASSLNDNGEIVGGGGAFQDQGSSLASQTADAYDWSSPTATPTTLKDSDQTIDVSGARINNRREIVGKGYFGDGSTIALYWKDADTKPVQLPGQTIQLFSGNTYAATDISQDGRIVGLGNGKPLYWADSTKPPISLAFSGTGTIGVLKVNSKGNIFARLDNGSVSHILFWSSPQVTAQTLTAPADSTSEAGSFMNENGDIVGSVQTSQGQMATLWKGGVPQVLNKTMPSAYNAQGDWYFATADAINDKGWILGTGSHIVNSTSVASDYVLIPK